MENTRAHPSVGDSWADPNNSRYYVVIVQYTGVMRPCVLVGNMGKQARLRAAKRPRRL